MPWARSWCVSPVSSGPGNGCCHKPHPPHPSRQHTSVHIILAGYIKRHRTEGHYNNIVFKGGVRNHLRTRALCWSLGEFLALFFISHLISPTLSKPTRMLDDRLDLGVQTRQSTVEGTLASSNKHTHTRVNAWGLGHSCPC